MGTQTNAGVCETPALVIGVDEVSLYSCQLRGRHAVIRSRYDWIYR
jgi:hypothetical protein